MNNEYTKYQIRISLEEMLEEARNPDPRKKIKEEREKRKNKILKKFGM